MEAKILLIGGDLPGVETVKNLVLPGVGSIHILDDQFVTLRDSGSNFFIPHETVGKLRAKILVKYLSEMNSDVKTFEALIKDPEKITKDDIIPYNFVIINQQVETVIQNVTNICE
jgi:amyloid beta precursor protein binding protein 1